MDAETNNNMVDNNDEVVNNDVTKPKKGRGKAFRDKFQVYITIRGQRIDLGKFKTSAEITEELKINCHSVKKILLNEEVSGMASLVTIEKIDQ